MSQRDAILELVRAAHPSATPLPDLSQPWTTYEDPVGQFREVLEVVGGTLHTVADLDEADTVIREMPVWQEATARVSLVPGVSDTTFDYAAVDDPRLLRDVDLAVLPAQFAVAENAAVWVPCEDALERTLNFLSQHVVYVLSGEDVGPLNTMHEAYARADIRRTPFGVFVAGPSKTADIEQSLVIGAHGARSLSVLLVG